METYSLLEKLKETIKRDYQDLEERCVEANNRIQYLEKENIQIKELAKQHQDENTLLKETLAKVKKELAYKDDKLKRKYKELHRKDQWWSQFRDETQRRFRAMKAHGTFPPHILEKYVNKDIFNELLNSAPADSSAYKEDDLGKKQRNLSTLKCKKKVRYNKVSLSQSSAAEEIKTRPHDNVHVNRIEEKQKVITDDDDDDDDVFPDANESTKLYQNSPQKQGGEIPVHPEVLVQETDYVYTEEVADGFVYSIGAPSATSTPLAAANSLPFDYDNDDDDDNDDDVSVGILDLPKQYPQDDTVDILTGAKSRLANLPKSDSQFPVDLSYTQPQSPTIPSRTRSLQQDMNLTADCSVSLLPHGMKNGEEQEPKPEYDSKMIKDNDETVFLSRETAKQSQQHKAENSYKSKPTKQTTLDIDFFNTKTNFNKNDVPAGKRKRESSEEHDEDMSCGKGKGLREEQSKTLFKVPIAPPPKTPEVMLLEEFPSRGADKKSCSTPLGSSGDITGLYTSGMDLFGNMDEHCSADLQEENKKDASLEDSEKENFSSKNEENNNATQENNPKDTNESGKPMGVRSTGSEPNYKYVEVVRKKDERAKLNGYKCRDCQQYYQGLDIPEDELKKRLKHCSRHRAKFSPPPSTPPGFWNLSFPDTQEYMDKGYLKTESQAPVPKRLRKTRRNKIAK